MAIGSTAGGETTFDLQMSLYGEVTVAPRLRVQGRVGGVTRLPRSFVLQNLAGKAAFPNSMAHVAFLYSQAASRPGTQPALRAGLPGGIHHLRTCGNSLPARQGFAGAVAPLR
ncbi:hypothetical protein [Thermincola ferriacetica]